MTIRINSIEHILGPRDQAFTIGTLRMLQTGDHVLFSNRVCTIMNIAADGRISLQCRDAGGIEWGFTTDRGTMDKLSEEQVLDYITKNVFSESSPRAETEVRMANLRVGDMFHEMLSYWVIIEELPADGRVLSVHSGRYIEAERTYEWIPTEHMSVADFRRAHSYNSIPGYTLYYSGNRILDKGHDRSANSNNASSSIGRDSPLEHGVT